MNIAHLRNMDIPRSGIRLANHLTREPGSSCLRFAIVVLSPEVRGPTLGLPRREPVDLPLTVGPKGPLGGAD